MIKDDCKQLMLKLKAKGKELFNLVKQFYDNLIVKNNQKVQKMSF